MIEKIDMSQRSQSNTAKKDYETIFFQGGYSVGPRYVGGGVIMAEMVN